MQDPLLQVSAVAPQTTHATPPMPQAPIAGVLQTPPAQQPSGQLFSVHRGAASSTATVTWVPRLIFALLLPLTTTWPASSPSTCTATVLLSNVSGSKSCSVWPLGSAPLALAGRTIGSANAAPSLLGAKRS